MIRYQIFLTLILIILESRDVASADEKCETQTTIMNVPDTIQHCVTTIRIQIPEFHKISNNTFENIPNLKVIAISGGKISIEENAFDLLTELQRVELYGMTLEPLPWKLFQHTPSLRYLSLGRIEGLNFSGSFPLLNAPQITLFKLGRALETFKLNPKSFQYLTNLTYLDLSDNGLNEISKEYFRPLSKLKVLKLDNNDLSTLPNDLFEHLILLEEVYIGMNRLISLPNQLFYNLPHLDYIDLSVNRLSKVPTNLIKRNLQTHNNTFIDLNSLYLKKIGLINLSFNNIAVLPKHLLELTDKIVMFSNPIHCDCELLPFLNRTFLDYKPCETPSFLKGKEKHEIVRELEYCENKVD